jgi:hypothetical protein
MKRRADGVWRMADGRREKYMADSISQKKQDFLCSCYQLSAIGSSILGRGGRLAGLSSRET